MPESTNLNVSPYFDDFVANSQYYKILFQPGVSVQVRELNVLQSMLQNQVEQFGDNILTKGTIVSGCSFQFYPAYPYVKIKDNDLFGVPVIPSNLVGFFAESSNSGLKGFIGNYADGFESQLPDLKSLFITYINGGTDNNTHIFAPGETLLITDANVAIWSINVVSSGIQFSNSDFPVFTPALVVNVTSGAFSNGDYVSQPSTLANLQIVDIDTSTLALEGQTILYLYPRRVDLANSLVNSNAWAVANNDSIQNLGNTAVGTVVSVVGNGAAGSILTDGSGRILQVPLATGGAGYEFLPTVAVRSIGNPTGLASINMVAQNFLTKVIAANTADAAGNGYAFGVGEGVIYQKGYFLRVNPQVLVVDKYDTTPNNISVGFHSIESIITPEQDPDLFDNALGTQNFQAPGANRLQVVPTLVSVDPSAITTDFFSIVSWSEGNPYLQRQDTSYGVLEQHLAQRLYETAGNFSINQFNITSRSPANTGFEGNTFSMVVDPGTAYVDGYRVNTRRNFVISDRKGTDTNTTANVSISLNYDDYIPIANVGGVFQFSTGDVIQLYDTAKGFLGNGTLVAAGNIAPTGTQVGTARIRSMVRSVTSGTAQPGDPNCTYNLYLFDLQMNQGKNFANVAAVSYNGSTASGIADVVLTQNQLTSTNTCQFSNTVYDTLVFQSGVRSLQALANTVYTYRTIDQGLSFANTGILAKTLTGSEYYAWANGTSLTADQMLTLYLVPFGGNMQASANVLGTVAVNTTVNVMTGSSTSFVSNLQVGDWVYIFGNSTVHDVRRVVSIANNTSIQMDANSTITKTGAALYRYFPQYVPIPLGVRTGMTANVDSGGQTLTLNLGLALAGSNTCNAALGVDVRRVNIGYGTKSAARDQWIVLKLSNNAGGVTGPWCLGVSDVVRLKQVARLTVAPPYTNTTLTSSSHDVTGQFYIDQRQNQDFVDLAFLYANPGNDMSLTTSDYLAVRYDAFEVTSSGFYVTPSYVTSNATTQQTNDSLSLGNLGSSINTFEIPLVTNGKGNFYDLTNCYDFRPIAVNTAISTANVTAATVNPVVNLSFGDTANPANDHKFPTPDSVLTTSITQYLGRNDAIFIGQDTNIFIGTGQAGGSLPNRPANCMPLGLIMIPPYPCLPQFLSNTMGEVITLRTLNESRRLRPRTIMTPGWANTVFPDQPRGYNMSAIGDLETRIRNLEYYVSLSALQTDMVNKIIPSGTDPTLNRFKYGLFVDNFSNGVSQAIDDPQYMATITTGVLTPETVSWVVRHGVGLQNAPYIDFPIVSQTSATGNLVPTVSSNAQAGWLLRVDADTVSSGRNPIINTTDFESVRFANATGTATLYIFVPETAASIRSVFTIFHSSAGHKADPDEFIIYQGNTQLKTASANGVALTNADVSFLQSNSVPAAWFRDTHLVANNYRSANGFVSGSLKLSWTHNPALGNQYTIKSVRQNTYDHWRWALNYPAIAPTIPAPQILSNGVTFYAGRINPDPTTFLLQIAPPPPFTSVGGGISAQGTLTAHTSVVTFFDAGFFSQHSDTQVTDNFVGGTPIAAGFRGQKQLMSPDFQLYNTSLIPQGFNFLCYGLKPNTKHIFSAAGVDQSAFVQPFGGNVGDPLITDASGTLDFDYFYTGASIQHGITSTLLSNTAPIKTSAQDWLAGVTKQPIGDGSVMFEVSAPNSLAQFLMTVAASPTISLNLLTHPGTVALLSGT